MKKAVLVIVIFLALFPTLSFSYTENICLLGPGDGVAGSSDQNPAGSDNLGTNGQDNANTWKIFRWQAGSSGEAYIFSVRMYNVLSTSIDIDTAYAVYDDNPSGPIPGALKIWGYENGHNYYSDTGCGGVANRKCFDIQNVVTNRTIVAGNYYWIAFRSTLGQDGGACTSVSCFERSNNTGLADWITKCISTATYDVNDMSQNPPTSAQWDAASCGVGEGVQDNFYGWAIWSTSDIIVSSATASISHNGSATITGLNFGTKSPAAPMWWDNGEGATDTALVPNYGDDACSSNSWITSGSLTGANKCYNDALPNAVTENSGISNIRYRGVGYRSVTAPHSKSTKYIAGAHDDEGECLGNEVGQNVGLTIGDTSSHDVWFAHYYLRLDLLWPISTNQNYKWVNFETQDAATRPTMYTNDYGYTYISSTGCTCDTGSEERSAPFCGYDYWNGASDFFALDYATVTMTSAPCGSPTFTHDQLKASPFKQWTREEWSMKRSTDYLKFSVNNKTYMDTTLGGELNDTRLPSSPTAITLGGFWREAGCGEGIQDDLNDDAFRYFDDVYVDSTFSRVMLCNNATYASATICEPQIPSSWADGSIIVTVNQGALPDGTAYLFVFDSTNTANDTGYPVALSGAPSATGCTIQGGVFR